ncbi:predicted protein [Clavispora lusitaniae ATCC 42720]|uniref:Uncharacterized protein n=1 Tax=Clavispora lusitaniae (strain ATCC 42720) TaxID=306902 RepID=C4YAA7_CLAL4|nr:uncharacterized protein CLUG_05045 [Clavispora lusitaniae ATCC 42720]EEQ40916.1 predicted protein [Clavispora lusitaniae ATCC 42720]
MRGKREMVREKPRMRGTESSATAEKATRRKTETPKNGTQTQRTGTTRTARGHANPNCGTRPSRETWPETAFGPSSCICSCPSGTFAIRLAPERQRETLPIRSSRRRGPAKARPTRSTATTSRGLPSCGPCTAGRMFSGRSGSFRAAFSAALREFSLSAVFSLRAAFRAFSACSARIAAWSFQAPRRRWLAWRTCLTI